MWDDYTHPREGTETGLERVLRRARQGLYSSPRGDGNPQEHDLGIVAARRLYSSPRGDGNGIWLFTGSQGSGLYSSPRGDGNYVVGVVTFKLF